VVETKKKRVKGGGGGGGGEGGGGGDGGRQSGRSRNSGEKMSPWNSHRFERSKKTVQPTSESILGKARDPDQNKFEGRKGLTGQENKMMVETQKASQDQKKGKKNAGTKNNRYWYSYTEWVEERYEKKSLKRRRVRSRRGERLKATRNCRKAPSMTGLGGEKKKSTPRKNGAETSLTPDRRTDSPCVQRSGAGERGREWRS